VSSSTFQSSGFSSRSNYFIHSNGSYLKNVTVTVLLGSSLSGYTGSSGCYLFPGCVNGGNWSLQVNGYSPPGYQAAYMQWVIGYGFQSILCDAEYLTTSDRLLFAASNQSFTPTQPFFQSGSKMQLTMFTNSTGFVVSVLMNLIRYDGVLVNSQRVQIPLQYQTPMVGFETQLIGYGNKETATFSLTDWGQFLYSSPTPLTFTASSPGTFSWVQYKNTGTAEGSNLAYSTLYQPNVNTITQNWQAQCFC
jgi:hypothetical protein